MGSPLSRWFAALVTCLLLVPTFAVAQIDTLETTPQTRDDRRFLFRVAAGPSYGSAFDSNQGPGVDASVAIGGFFSHSFALHASLLASTQFRIFHNADESNRVLTLGGGLGVTYYSDGGVYGSFSYMAGSQKTSDESWLNDTTIIELLSGKEWGQGGIGYGVALGFFGAIRGGENSDAQFSGGGSIRFSMTVR